MKAITGSRRHRCAAGLSIFLIMVTLTAGIVGCVQPVQYSLTISSTAGGEVTSPGEGTFSHYAGEVVTLIALAGNDYRFANWAGDVSTVADPNAATTTITMNDNYSVMANFHEIPSTYYSEEGVVTFPDLSIGTAIRGDISERGYLFPSDIQDHNPLH
jgi:hypothetical protein